MTGTVYTETVIHAAPQQFMTGVPYQIVIVTLDTGERVTGRAVGERVEIDDRVEHIDDRSGVPFFRKI